jgi:hypothetical protein
MDYIIYLYLVYRDHTRLDQLLDFSKNLVIAYYIKTHILLLFHAIFIFL